MNANAPPRQTLPASWYHDPAIYERERAHIFGNQWILFGHEASVEKPGEYQARTIAGWPLFVIRGNDGALNGFHNVCRHRAAPLLDDGIGRTMALRCPYHGWTYKHTGQLHKTLGFGGDEAALCDRISLFPLHVKTWRSLIFVCLAQDAPSFEDALGDLPDAAKGSDFDTFKRYKLASHKLNCNWKTYVENYMEGYHIPHIHPELNKEVDMTTYRVEPGRNIARHISEIRAERAAQAMNGGLWVWVWPFAALNVYKGGMNLELMVPTGPETMELHYQYFFRDISPASEQANEDTIAMSKSVTQEDIDICEKVQRNLKAGVYQTGELSPNHEGGLAYFQDLIRQALAGE